MRDSPGQQEDGLQVPLPRLPAEKKEIQNTVAGFALCRFQGFTIQVSFFVYRRH